ncbi:hypothetical protein [Massilia sp. TSP1-1-2]|uniref:hypothetical protein n=1 Tax=unclassified Massilia TaxID=2609279 RepID=UPI003CEBE2D7
MKIVHSGFLVLSILSVGCQPDRASPPVLESAPARLAKQGPNLTFTQEMISLVDQADKILVTEHSSIIDALDSQRGISLVPVDIVYQSKILSEEQTSKLVALLWEMDQEVGANRSVDLKILNTPEVSSKSCIFAPHHSITFFLQKNEPKKMSIDFACGRAEWAGSAASVPGAFISKFYGFAKLIGINPLQNWEDLAAKHLKSDPEKKTSR